MRKVFLKSIVYPLFVIVFLVFTFPFIVSTKTGQKQFFKFLSVLTRSSIEVDQIKLSWFSNQQIDHLKIKSPALDLTIEKIFTHDSLFKTLFRGGMFSHVEIIRPEGSIKFSQGKKSFFFIPSNQLEVNQGNFQFQTLNETYFVKNLHLQTHFDQKIQIQTDGIIEEENQTGKFSIDFSFKKNTLTDFSAKFSSLPVSTFDEFLRIIDYNYSLSNIIGKSLNGSIEFNPHKSICVFNISSEYANLQYNSLDKTPFSCLIDSPRLGKKLLYSNQIEINFSDLLKSHAIFQLQIDKSSFESFEFTNIKSEITLNGHEEIKYHGSCFTSSDKFKGELNFDGFLDHLNQSIAINLKSDKLAIFDPILSKLSSISGLSCNLNFQEQKWYGNLQIEKFLSTFEQQRLQVELSSNECPTFLVLPEELHCTVDSSFFKFDTLLSLDQIFQTKSSSPFIITLNPSLLKSLQTNYPIDSSLKISGNIDKGSSIDEVKGSFFTEPFFAKFSRKTIETKIFESTFLYDPKTANGELHILGSCNEGQFDLHLSKDSKNEWALKTKLHSIPIDLLQSFIKTDLDGELIFGNLLSGSIQYTSRMLKKIIEGQLQTSYLETKFSGALEEKTFSFTKPSKIIFKLPPRTNLNWFNSPSLYLVSEPKITLEFQDLTIPLNLDFSDLVTRGKLSIEDLKFYHNHEIGVLDKIYGEWKKKKEGSLTAYFNGVSPIGKIESSLEIDRIQLTSPKALLPTFVGSYHLYMQDFPTLFVKAFLAPFVDHDFAVIFGDKVNLDYKYLAQSFPRVMQFNLQSTSCNFSLSGLIDGDVFNLIKPLSGTVEINEQIKDLLIDLINIEILDIAHPVQLEASSKGFSIPIVDPNIKNIKIPYFRSTIGKIFVKNSGTISLLDQFLKTKLPEKTQLWFTPLECKLNNGIITLSRFDVLVSNNLPIAFWGVIDCNKRYVDCTIGLSAQSLKTTLGIKGLPEDFYLTIPLKGPFGKVKIDKTRVLTKISALIASLQKFTGKLGGVLDLMNQLMNDQGKIPKAKRPFPWEIPLTSADIEIKKSLPIQFKKHLKEEEFLSYSVSIDPLLNLLQEQINQILVPNDLEEELSDENIPKDTKELKK